MSSGVAVSHGYLIGDPTGVVIALDCVTVNQLVRQVRVDSSAALFKKKIHFFRKLSLIIVINNYEPAVRPLA